MTHLIREQIRDIPDFPKPGILFKDITPLLGNPEAFELSLQLMETQARALNAVVVVGTESRGFLFGAPLALRMGLPFVPARKPGKLPAPCARVEYTLEYGTDVLEMHKDAFKGESRVVIVDDLLATGGTAAATGDLVEKVGGKIGGFIFLIELDFLSGRKRLENYPVHSLLHY